LRFALRWLTALVALVADYVNHKYILFNFSLNYRCLMKTAKEQQIDIALPKIHEFTLLGTPWEIRAIAATIPI